MTTTRKLIALIGVSLLSFTAYLDATIVSTALPAIQSKLKLDVTELQWIMNIFFLALSALMISMGKIADFFGSRCIFYVATALFTIASLGAALSSTGGLLIFFRALQGIACAATVPVGMVIVQKLFTGRLRSHAIGIFSAITGSGLALGPIVGGILVGTLGWQAIFYVNLPIIAIGLLCCIPCLPELPTPDKEPTLDYLGMLLMVIALATLIFATVEANVYHWNSWLIRGNLFIGLLTVILFFYHERHIDHPIIAISLFKNRVFIPMLLYAFVGGGTMAIMLFITPLYLSIILQQSHVMVGIYLFIMSFMVTIGSPLISLLNEKINSKKISLLGICLLFITAVMMLQLPPTQNVILLCFTFIVFGLAWAIFNTITAIIFTDKIEHRFLSSAMGSLYSTWNIGASLLLAIGVTFFHMRTMFKCITNFILIHEKLTPLQLRLLDQFVEDPSKLSQIAKKLPVHNHNAAILLKNAFIQGMHIMLLPTLILSTITFIIVWTRVSK